MKEPHRNSMRLYNRAQQRLYINEGERQRVLKALQTTEPLVQSLCLTLLHTGCRLSEALELRGTSIQAEAQIVTFRTLKRRSNDVFREVPVPLELVDCWRRTHDLDADVYLFRLEGKRLHRTTAYRWIKGVMVEAMISGAQAVPKGMRHGFGIHAISKGVPLNMIQKWMGHAQMSTTAIYVDATGEEELAIAKRMWE